MHRLDIRVQAGVLDGEGQVSADALERPRVERVEGVGMRVVPARDAGQAARRRREPPGRPHRCRRARVSVSQRTVAGQAQDGDGSLHQSVAERLWQGGQGRVSRWRADRRSAFIGVGHVQAVVVDRAA